ncbi:MAG TPA: CpsB/CapC family capsule biosynthesis tyrosine phosphatase [Flavisolibacter sp.]|nr:CpsB/CapC family capsule biosynthesis tyrosine phosphatase [Flavisolibacter sp.]
MHSHLIPGIDDGSPDMATSLELIRGLRNLGYKKLVTTPHILWEVYPNTTDTITTGLKSLQKAVETEGIEIELRAAAEYFIDEHFEEQLKNKVPLLPISGNMVLVEFSMITAPMDLQQVLFEMQIQNYQPIIAHPERYIYLAQRKHFFDELKEAGCLFQLNLLALTGYYGKPVQELADYLLKNNFYSFAGTDLHGQRHLAALQKLSSSAQYARLKEGGFLKNGGL